MKKILATITLLIIISELFSTIKIHNKGKVVLHNKGILTIEKDFINEGSFSSESNGIVTFSGNYTSTINSISDLTLSNLTINKSTNNVTLLTNLNIENSLEFINGNLLTDDSQVNLLANATISGESETGFLSGKLVVNKTLTTEECNFGGAGFTLSSGVNSLGNTELTRITGADGVVSINNKQGIAQKWHLSTEAESFNRNLTLNWASENNNNCNLNFAKVWNSQNEVSWETTGSMQDASAQTIVVPATQNGFYTVNSAATINLPDNFTLDEDSEINVDLAPYIDNSSKSYTITITENQDITASITGSVATFTPADNFNGEENLKFTLTETKSNKISKGIEGIKNQPKVTYFDYANIIVTAVNDPLTIESYFPVESEFAITEANNHFSVKIADIDTDYENISFQWYLDEELQASTDSTYAVNLDLLPEGGDYSIKVVGSDGEFNVEQSWLITFSTSGIITNLIPEKTKLYQNYPNPFNPVTNINYSIKNEGFCNISVYNYKGQKVEELVNKNHKQGWYQIKFGNKRNYSSGAYYIRMKTKDYCNIKKAILVK